ncbi:MAG: extracellular solute-binding protein [Clostridia bacterium]|nr:extracellular solute-binding protein [Clostridia bacterium]
MKKIFNSILAICLASAFSVLAVSCGGQTGDDDKQSDTTTPADYTSEFTPDEIDESLTGNLSIRFYRKGFGAGYINSLVAAFKTKYPNVSVSSSAVTTAVSIFGEAVGGIEDKYDIFITETSSSTLIGYVDMFESLNDVYAYTNQNESVKIEDKLEDIHKMNFSTASGKYYAVPVYNATYGLVYNSDYLEDGEIPYTTDEFITLLRSLRTSVGGSFYPLAVSGGDSSYYWKFMYSTWFAQYEGLENYTQMQKGRILKDGEYVVDPSSAYLEGGLKAMQACEDILWLDNGFVNKQSVGRDALTAQKDLITNSAAFVYTGSWLLNEMATTFAKYEIDDVSNIRMMKVPVLSAIVEKCPSISDDAELSALIKAIDQGSKELGGAGYEVTQADFDKIYEARNFVYTGVDCCNAVIPTIAKNKELAKTFLKFMLSDHGAKALVMSKVGCASPIKNFDCTDALGNIEPFLKDVYGFMLNNVKFGNLGKDMAISPYCTDEIKVAGSIEKQFCSPNVTDRTRAVDSYNAKKTTWTANNNRKFYEEMNKAGYEV